MGAGGGAGVGWEVRLQDAVMSRARSAGLVGKMGSGVRLWDGGGGTGRGSGFGTLSAEPDLLGRCG